MKLLDDDDGLDDDNNETNGQKPDPTSDLKLGWRRRLEPIKLSGRQL